MAQVSVACDLRLILGEGPYWCTKKQCLYYVDIRGPLICKYTPATKKLVKCSLPSSTISIVIPIEGTDDEFIITWGRRVAKMTWDGESPEPQKLEALVEIDTEERLQENKLNDGKFDPTGRWLYCGTMGPDDNSGSNFTLKLGSLYKFDLKNRKAEVLYDGIDISNGMDWNKDSTKMYYVDSLSVQVDVMDFEAETGKTSNRKCAFSLKDNGVEGFPDGMCIDTEGMLWIAVFDGFCVIRVDPATGQLLQKVTIPTRQITSCAFGGPNLDILYVTSASMGPTEADNPSAGLLFQVTGLGVKGLPPTRANFK